MRIQTGVTPLSRSILALPLVLAPLMALPVISHAQTGAEAQLVLPDTALAEEAPEVRAVFEAMGLYGVLEVMSAEGLDAATNIEADMFPGQGRGAWRARRCRHLRHRLLVAQFRPSASFRCERDDRRSGSGPELQAYLTTADLAAVVRRENEVAARQSTSLEPTGVERCVPAPTAQTASADGRPQLCIEPLP